jgi:hypothetical protein
MNRRDFLAASTLAGLAPLAPPAAGAGQDDEPEYYELRRYRLLYGPKEKLVHDFLGEVAVPALNRIGIGPVGAFNVLYGPNEPSLYVLLPHRDLASVATARRRLAEDEAFRREGAGFLDVPLSDPAYVRVESSLLRAFAGMPRLEVPPQAAANGPRLFELRTYESHSDPAALRKIEMFDRGGEIAIFRRTGLRPVFFAETLIGQALPNLVYLLVFDDLAARDAAWDRFSKDPDWEKLAADPYYADTVSAISDFILKPTAYSQV